MGGLRKEKDSFFGCLEPRRGRVLKGDSGSRGVSFGCVWCVSSGVMTKSIDQSR